jgi:two-component system, chemotaxis family, sensor kinase CheA
MPLKSRENTFKALFKGEEIRGDKTINGIRFFACFVLMFLALLKAGLFTGLVVSTSLVMTILILSFSTLYSIVLFFLFRKKIYNAAIKYVSVTVDISLIVLSIFVYKFESPAEYAKILFLARYAVLLLFIFLTILRYNFQLSLYAGIYATAAYIVFVIAGNYMYGAEFSFTGPDGKIYISHFAKSEVILHAVYLLLAGIAVSAVTVSVRRLVTDSIRKEQERSDLDHKNKLIDSVNQENKKYLDNILDGLLLINKDLTISAQYSKSLVHIFEHESIAGLRFIDFIFPDEIGQAGQRKELLRFLTILFNSTISDYEMIEDANPLKDAAITITDLNGNTKNKNISAYFHRITDGNSIINILVIIKDTTLIKKAEKQLVEERRRRENEVETIASILNVGPSAFSDFMADAVRILNEIEDGIASVDNPNILTRVFRSLHTLKGTARTIGFRTMADLTHNIEEHLVKIREGDSAVTDELIAFLKSECIKLFDEYGNIKKLNDRFRHFTLAVLNSDASGSSAIEELTVTLRKMAEEEAGAIGKQILFTAEITVESFPYVREIRGALIHLIRNSVDHGIENQNDRIAAGKKKKGLIHFSVSEKNSMYEIEVSDDGQGLNYEKIRKDAVASGRIKDKPLLKSEVLKLLFQPGFSTKNRASALSGRGVGLDAVHADVRALGGRIKVSSETGKGSRFTILLPLK